MTNTGMFELCYLYYDEKTMEHAKRVAQEAKHLCCFFKLPYDNWENFVYQLGLAHDLYEDTNIKQGTWFDSKFEKNLQLLTKGKDEDYNEYIGKIHDVAKDDKECLPAYIVKLADIWDHFAQVDTLTEKLKNKYVAAMPYLI